MEKQMSKQWYVVDYADDLVVNAGTYSTMETLIKKLHGGLALVQYADLTPQMKQGETIHETKEKQMKNLQPFIDNIIMRATTLMNEYSDMMEAYEMSDYAEKCEMLDELWVAIDEYLKEVKLDDDDEMEDLGLS
jgi:uncharacterized protein (DUF4213/DUF364 family)